MEKNRTLVTGASRGIGAHLASRLAAAGHRVVGCGRSGQAADDGFGYLPCDVTDEKQVVSLLHEVRKRLGGLDNLINCAGVAKMNHVILTPASTADFLFGVNVKGTFLACREAAKLMMKTHYGRIVNFGSVAAPMELEGEALYAASKSAVVTFSRIFAREMASFDITCNVVSPSPVRTDLIRNVPAEKIQALIDRMPIKRMGTMDDVWNAVEFFLRPESDFITGQVLVLGGRVMALEWLFERLAEFGGTEALVWKGRSFSYAGLLEKCASLEPVLRGRRDELGPAVAVEGEFSPGTVALMLALLKEGYIYVPLGQASRDEKEKYKKIARVRTCFRFAADDSYVMTDEGGTIDIPLLSDFATRRIPGLVLFSSGSTGESKGILQDMAKLCEKYRKRRPTLRTMLFLAFDHIGGVNTLLHSLSNGSTLVVPEGKDPPTICRQIQDHSVELLPASPSFCNLMLLSGEYRDYDLSSLKAITYGTEVMPDSTLKMMAREFPRVRLQQTYGLSEVGILRSKSLSSDSKFVKLGGEGFELKIVDQELWIKADSAMIGYLNAPSPFTEDGWLKTGDLVETEGDFLLIKGRKSDIINVGGEKVFPAEVENVLMEMPEIRDVTVYGETNPLMGQIVVALVTPADPEATPAAIKKAAAKFCRGRLSRFKIPVKIRITSADQFNYRYKKLREKLKDEGDA